MGKPIDAEGRDQRRHGMDKEKIETCRGRAAAAGLLWSFSGFAAAWFPLGHGLNLAGGLEWAAWGLTAAYLGALAYFDYLFFRVPGPGIRRLMVRYWGISALGLGLWLLGGRAVWDSEQGGVLAALALLCAFTPFSAVLPMTRSCFSGGLWSTIIGYNTVTALTLSLVQLLFFLLLRRREPGRD